MMTTNELRARRHPTVPKFFNGLKKRNAQQSIRNRMKTIPDMLVDEWYKGNPKILFDHHTLSLINNFNLVDSFYSITFYSLQDFGKILSKLFSKSLSQA